MMPRRHALTPPHSEDHHHTTTTTRARAATLLDSGLVVAGSDAVCRDQNDAGVDAVRGHESKTAARAKQYTRGWMSTAALVRMQKANIASMPPGDGEEERGGG